MRIEEIEKKNLMGIVSRMDDKGLKRLRFRFIQMFEKYFLGNIKKSVGIMHPEGTVTMKRSDLLDNYLVVVREFRTRKLKITSNTLDLALFKRAMLGLDIQGLGELMVLKNYVVLGGSFTKGPAGAKELQVLIQDKEENRDEILEQELGRILKEGTGIEPKFSYVKEGGIDSTYIPVFDLMLKAKIESKRLEPMKLMPIEVSKDLSPAQRKECDAETEKIRENSKNARFPHKFKAAKYTHPNGHPRCIICGDEETLDAICRKAKIEKGVIAYHDYGAAEESASWDAGKEVREAEVEDLKKMCAWYDSENPDVKSSYKLPHHRKSDKKAVWRAVFAAMAALLGARGGVRIPSDDKKGVYGHLKKHYAQFDKEPPELRKRSDEEIENEFLVLYEEDIKANEVIEKGEAFDIKKPYPNEHSARLQDPGKYDAFRRTKDGKLYGNRIKVPADVSIIWGHPKGQPPKMWIPQALRFPKDSWDISRAKKWLDDNNVNIKLFEPAQATKKADDGYFFKFVKIDKKKQVVGGVVYTPDKTDTQGDYTDAEEIEKAMYKFMEKYAADTRKIRVMHKGKTLHFPILESFQPDTDIQKGDQTIKAGSWWIMIKIPDKTIWKLVEEGKLTGFSMGGRAKS